MTSGPFSEAFVSVDVETAGPNPSQYSLLAIGACLVSDPAHGFYVELQPVNANAIPEAMAIHELSLGELAARGLPPADALARFEQWLASEIPSDQEPIFVAFNAPFDWMFVADYFHRFLGRNPFGHSALDVKSYYMGLSGVHWSETSMRYLAPRYLKNQPLSHHALRDAQDQAELFKQLLTQASKNAL
jgi:DNA polymerase III epsilon subunit-like protein